VRRRFDYIDLWISHRSGGIMAATTPPTPASEHKGQEQYGLQDSEAQRAMVFRSAERQAAFLLPHLRPGMHLLDCGCGPGSITTDFARRITPGQVVGIDLSAGEVERATARAAELGITNVQFKTGDVYNLPFADATFDAVYSNALLDHLSDPLAALSEMRRVLKSGGVAGVRTADRDGYLWSPPDPLIAKWQKESEEWKAAQGVNVRIGKHLRSYLRQVGFARTEGSASYDTYGTPETVARLSRAAVAGIHQDIAETGDMELQAVASAFEKWGASPDAFFAMSFCEGLGWVE
jgi:ubiquinone/menaquinone biosynthesis C-methylase UbiE